MDISAKRKSIWNAAAAPGLFLGLFTGVILLFNMWAGLIGNQIFTGVLISLLWVIKVFGCIWILKVFIIQYSVQESAPKSKSIQFGLIVAAASALISAGCYLGILKSYDPQQLADTLNTVTEQYSALAGNNPETVSALKEMTNNFIPISFVFRLIYCFLFGAVATWIIVSRGISDKDEIVRFFKNQ